MKIDILPTSLKVVSDVEKMLVQIRSFLFTHPVPQGVIQSPHNIGL